jgi:hypothetical protein
MTDDLEARRERNIRERANRPYFKRVFDEMTSGYQPDQTSSNSIYLRPRTNPFRPPNAQDAFGFGDDGFEFQITNPRSIITRLRIWVRKALKIRMNGRRDLGGLHYGGFGKNLIGRAGWGVTMSLRQPGSSGQAIMRGRQLNPHGRWSTAVYGSNNTIWKKNQRARLF